jgi:GR25 family glycosyltransferase involved in LPS biosynthesis
MYQASLRHKSVPVIIMHTSILCVLLALATLGQSLPKIFIVNLAHRTDRRAAMESQLQRHSAALGRPIPRQYIEAIDKEAHKVLVDFYWFNDTRSQAINSSPGARACFLSHIRALRQFATLSSDASAIIAEDDAQFHRDFVPRVEAAIAAHPEASVILFSSYIQSQPDWPAIDAANTLFLMANTVWSTMTYYITRTYAKQIIAKFDRPLRFAPLPGHMHGLTSEVITQGAPVGYFVWPSLVVDQGVCAANSKSNIDDDTLHELKLAWYRANPLGADSFC